MPIKNSAFDSELSLKNLESLGKKTEEPTFISKLSDKVNSSNLGVSTFPLNSLSENATFDPFPKITFCFPFIIFSN